MRNELNLKFWTALALSLFMGPFSGAADWMAPSRPLVSSLIETPDGLFNGGVEVNDVTDVTDFFGNTCLPFSSPDRLGQWGQTVASEISSGAYPDLFMGPPDVQQICPKYNRLSTVQRQNLWVVILNSMASYESSCRPTVPAPGVHGRRAVGLFQLHAGHEGQYSGGCRNGDGINAVRSIKCTLSMINEQVQRDGLLFSDASYWAVLRPHNAVQRAPKIEKSVSMFAGCR